jgi:hypothetical protein
MNIIEVQENLKDFSKQQLVDEMQNPRGVAPQFLVLGELNRRKRMEDSYQQQMTASQKTVAEDAINAAGVPQGGIADMARMMAPKSSVAQNSGMSYAPPQTGEAVPSDAVIGMAIGGTPRDRSVQIGGTGIGSSGALTQDDLAATAAKFGITVDDLKKQLGIAGFGVTPFKPTTQVASANQNGVASLVPPQKQQNQSTKNPTSAITGGQPNSQDTSNGYPESILTQGGALVTPNAPHIDLRTGKPKPIQTAVQNWWSNTFGSTPNDLLTQGGSLVVANAPSVNLSGTTSPNNNQGANPNKNQGLTEEEMKMQPPAEKSADDLSVGSVTATDDGYGSIEELLKQYYQSSVGDRNFDKWMSVAQAGLAMMQSEEPTLAGALGEAGTAGLKAYNDAQKRYREGLGDVINARVALQKARASSGLTLGDQLKSAQEYYDLAAKRAELLTNERGLSESEMRDILIKDPEWVRYVGQARALEEAVLGTRGNTYGGDVTE